MAAGRARRRPRGRRRASRRAVAPARLRAGGGAEPIALPPPPRPGAQYVPAVASGRLLFVSGHDPERRGRLVYRGRVGRDLAPADARAAARLAALNALAAAAAAAGSLARLRRCLAVTCFVDATPGALSPAVVGGALALLRRAFGPGAAAPVVWLRPAAGLAAGMPVEVELLLELAPD